MDKQKLENLLKKHQPDIIWIFQEFEGCSCGLKIEYTGNKTEEDQYTEHLAEVIAKEMEQ